MVLALMDPDVQPQIPVDRRLGGADYMGQADLFAGDDKSDVEEDDFDFQISQGDDFDL